MSRFYKEEYKWYLYTLFTAGYTLADLSRETGITDKPLREWFKRFDVLYYQYATITLEDILAETEQVHCQITELQTELDIVHKSKIINTIAERLRINLAQTILPQYGPNLTCRMLNIRKSNLYYQLFRSPAETVYEKHNQQLRPLVLAEYKKSHGRIGAERIRIRLREKGIITSKEKILELLREIKPSIVRQSHSKNVHGSNTSNTFNILNRNFNPPAPNKVWVSDITDLKTDEGTYSFCVILDLFSRKVIAARLGAAKDAKFVCETFEAAYNSRHPPRNLLFHSDQGPQYTSFYFRELLEMHSVIQSFSTPGVPYDNAPMESFFSSLKTEESHRYRYRTKVDLIASLKDYITYYNTFRPHTSVGNIPPDQAEHLYYINQNEQAASVTADRQILLQ